MFDENYSPEREGATENTAPNPPADSQRGSQYYYSGAPTQSFSTPTPPPQRPQPAYSPVVNRQPTNVSSYEVGTAPKKQNKAGAGKIVLVSAIVAVASALIGSIGGFILAKDYMEIGGKASGGGNVVMMQSVDNGSSSPTLSNEVTIAEVAEKVAPSVVEITTEIAQGGGFMSQYITEGAGSGVIISADGYIVTNNHVIEGANKINVITSAGKSYEAVLVGTDELTDIAVIKIEATELTPAVYGTSSTLKVGDFALAVGNPLGKLGGTVTNGIISALERQVSVGGVEMTLLQTNAAINPGNSGGGLFNASGELIGVVNAKAAGEDIEGLGFAIPIDIAKPVIQDILAYGHVTGRVQAGIKILDVLDYITAFQYRVTKLGPYIYSVNAGSDAERAGLEAGDLVLKLDGKEVANSTAITSFFAKCKVGQTVTVTIERDGKQMDIKMTFTEQ